MTQRQRVADMRRLAVLAGRWPQRPAGELPRLRVMSLDQCADQYVLALASRGSIVGVSYRAGDPDSYLRDQAVNVPRRRATAEAVLAVRPDVVVSYWGGDAAAVRAPGPSQGVKMVQI